jgi:excisionase family DNA binding protein
VILRIETKYYNMDFNHEKLVQEQKNLKNSSGLFFKEILSFKEALDFLDISASMLYKLTHKRSISFFKPSGKLIYFQKKDLLSWLMQNKQISIEESEREMENYLSKNS